MLTINNPDDAEKRQNVKPLTVEEEDTAIKYFNYNFHLYTRHMSEPGMVLLQSLIHNYENYRHFFEVVGGWDGLSKLQERVISTPFDGYSNPVAEMLQKGIETIKTKNNETTINTTIPNNTDKL